MLLGTSVYSFLGWVLEQVSELVDVCLCEGERGRLLCSEGGVLGESERNPPGKVSGCIWGNLWLKIRSPQSFGWD